MLFNSLPFLGFFCAVYAAYVLLTKHTRAQNALLLSASYCFYGYWDYRFCFLLAATTTAQYLLGRSIDRAPPGSRQRKRLVTLAVSLSLTVLGLFKYFGFFATSLNAAMAAIGLPVSLPVLHLVLPVGMSFYTFKEISYVVDIYRQDAKPARDPIAFALYVAFFPQLIAGPIERARDMLPQILKARRISAADVDIGLHLVLWGFLKKSVVADNLGAKIVDPIFLDPSGQAGLDMTVAVIAYTFQIYCDFSGYSDIARGLARLMGFDLPLNFRLPYFAAEPSEFWRRWHVTLSSWLRDYLYIPLGGSRGSRLATYRNLTLTMLLGGLWHGAAWTFVVWGGFHAALLVLYRLGPLATVSETRGVRRGLAIAVMFTLCAVGWVFFRATSLEQAATVFAQLSLQPSASSAYRIAALGALVAPVVAFEALEEHSRNLLLPLRWPAPGRALFYASVLAVLTLFAVRERTEFIYFQF